MSLISTQELADLCGCTKRHLQRMISDGKVPSAQRTAGGHWEIPDSDEVREWARVISLRGKQKRSLQSYKLTPIDARWKDAQFFTPWIAHATDFSFAPMHRAGRFLAIQLKKMNGGSPVCSSDLKPYRITRELSTSAWGITLQVGSLGYFASDWAEILIGLYAIEPLDEIQQIPWREGRDAQHVARHKETDFAELWKSRKKARIDRELEEIRVASEALAVVVQSSGSKATARSSASS